MWAHPRTRRLRSRSRVGIKTVRIFSDRIRDRIRLERFRSVRIRVRIFIIRYRIRIRILKSYICDVDIQLYLIRHGWYYSYSNPNPTKNMKTNMISVISVRIRSVFIPNRAPPLPPTVVAGWPHGSRPSHVGRGRSTSRQPPASLLSLT